MFLEARLHKRGRHWLIEAPALDVMTQGTTRRDAAAMLEDALGLLVDRPGFRAKVRLGRGPTALLSANDPDVLTALMLRRQRQKHGLTLQQLARRMGSSSPNAFARYEQGKARPSLAKLQQLLSAIDPDAQPVLRLA